MQEMMAIVHKSLGGVALKSLTDEQKVKLKNNYNCKLYLFDYGLNASGDLVIHTTRGNYTNLLYYMGFDPAKSDSIKLKIEVADDVVVIYNMENERVTGLAEKLGLVG